jgi:purine-binding chemotaxis protein CheW
MEARRQYCSFRLGEILFGIEAERVREVLRSPGCTPVPLAPPPVRGLMNLRGHILTVLNLRGPLGLPDAAPGQATMSVVLRHKGEWVALEVDEVGDVLEVDTGSFEEAPSTLTGEAKGMIRGAFKLEGRLLLELDVEKAAMMPI